jgi:cell division protein FtsN
MNQQRGSTLIGFVVGVLVGLGLALAMAVYVNKVPISFANKGQTRSPEQDAIELQKNKDWDPNAPLYGKNPAKPAPVASGAVGVAPAPAPSASAPSASASKAEPKADAKPDALGELAAAKAGASAPADAGGYFVQAGAFRTPEEAEAQRAKLSLQGVQAKVSEREQSGRTVYRVRTGPYDKKEEADKLKEKLEAAGFEVVLIRVQR